ncbi:MAG TPA: hypothetical protein VFD66_02670, partial [Verrucomicrobiae bacterium]|nr:hypothetical protein [Verrucomicrobiae bacterium]
SRTLTRPAGTLSHPMGEGDGGDARGGLMMCDCSERVDDCSLSRRTGEGWGEGFLPSTLDSRPSTNFKL